MSEEAYLNALCLNARIDFFNLLKKTWTVALTYATKFGENDARFMFFQHYVALNVWLLISLDTYLEMLDVNDKKISRYMEIDSKTRILYLFTHDKLNRIAYVTSTMFYVEDFMKNLMRGIQKPPKGKYFEFTKDFLNHLGITDPQKHKILNVPYQLRNSLHNNGYAYHDFDIT